MHWLDAVENSRFSKWVREVGSMPTNRAVMKAAGSVLLLPPAVVLLLSLSHGRLSAQAIEVTAANDPIARLGLEIDKGEVSLDYQRGRGYLPALLRALDINVDSQVLVFSKTSFQQKLISPRAPRAIFFNDRVAVGSVQNGEVLEIAALDPVQGMNFYSLDVKQAAQPEFRRRGTECMFCHLPGNYGAPGLVVVSVLPNAEGTPFFSGSFFISTDHRTPFEDRWGGWYVTGTHGSLTHMGNAIAPDPDRPTDLDQSRSQNVTTLGDRFDVTSYLAPTSDIVALMTLEHQAGAVNRMLGLSRQYERAQRKTMDERTNRAIDAAIDDLVGYLLFIDEAPLREPVAGVSTFARTFPTRGPRDSGGRSLRDFDLQRRLFRYPLSYMVYNETFDGLPGSVRDRVYRRLYDVLTGQDRRQTFAGLSEDERRTAFEILVDTKPNLPDYWHQPSPVG